MHTQPLPPDCETTARVTPSTPPLERALDNLTTALTRSRRMSPSPSEECDRPLGATRPCPDCGTAIEWRELIGPTGRAIRYWSDCPCWRARIARLDAFSAAAANHQAAQHGAASSRIGEYARFAFDTFNPARLPNGFPLVANARDWLARGPLAQPTCTPDYTTPATCALYFYSPGKGRGKTHLAAALALLARAEGHLIAIIDERRFIDEYWGAPFEVKPALTQLASMQARLTVYDDIGARENRPAGLRDAWDLLISPRWTRMGWAIFTSNYTPMELLDRGTIDDRVYSRLMQMTQGRYITFDGRDQRLPASPEGATHAPSR